MIITKHKNGNCQITIHSDGTKEREWGDGEIPIVEFPESVDYRLTNHCDAGCQYCHEGSTVAGKHAPLSTILQMVEGLPNGTEMALGGGNPLSHPDIIEILQNFKNRHFISNMTVNIVHAPKYSTQIMAMCQQKLLYGLGISWANSSPKNISRIDHIMDQHSVVHVINGVDDPVKLMQFPKDWKILILGYKQFGFGLKHYSAEVVAMATKMKAHLHQLLSKYHVSFDNLAIEQLGLKGMLTNDAWDTRYMGEDGVFTMYIDAVDMTYAKSSTSERRDFARHGSILGCFKEIQNEVMACPAN